MATLATHLRLHSKKPPGNFPEARIKATMEFYDDVLLPLLTTETAKDDNNAHTPMESGVKIRLRIFVLCLCIVIARVNKEVPYTQIETGAEAGKWLKDSDTAVSLPQLVFSLKSINHEGKQYTLIIHFAGQI